MDKSKDGFLGFHHGYLGLLLLLIGFLLVFTKLPIWVSLIFILSGAPIFGSDYHQHYRQRTDPDYQDWMHKIYVWALRKMMKSKYLGWLGNTIYKVNAWFDKLLGRRS